jgi:hypothetical protein
MTWYLTVRPDRTYSRSTPAGPLVEYLRSLPELVQTGPQEFRNAAGFPWVHLCLARADSAGNYAIAAGDAPPQAINVLELVCGDGSESWYESLAGRMAAFLCWEAVEEHSGWIIHPGE